MMRIRDSFATINGSEEEYTMPSGGLEIIADDGRTLYDIRLNKDGSLHISAGSVCKHGGILLDDKPIIRPKASNCFNVYRLEYEP